MNNYEFLQTIGHNYHNFLIQDVCQHSGETVTSHFQVVLQTLVTFAKEMIKPPLHDDRPPRILKNLKYYPSLRIVSVQSTGHKSLLLFQQQRSFHIGLDEKTSADRMEAIYPFNMRFTRIRPGWEDSARDFHIFMEANKT